MELYLICKVVRVEHDFYVAGLANEGLRLFGLSAEHSGLPAIRHIRFRISIHDLKGGQTNGINAFENVLPITPWHTREELQMK